MLRYKFSTIIILAVLTLSLMPAEEFPRVDARFADKWAHWVMYASVSFIIGLETMRSFRTPLRIIQAMGVILFATVLGGLLELAQAYLTTTRSGDCLDALANTFGALCGVLLLYLVRWAWKALTTCAGRYAGGTRGEKE